MEPKLPPMQLTATMVKDSKTLTCECGGMIFEEAIFFKSISPIVSPTGKEELYPIGVVVCKKCGKVPSVFNKENVVPSELLAVKQMATSIK